MKGKELSSHQVSFMEVWSKRKNCCLMEVKFLPPQERGRAVWVNKSLFIRRGGREELAFPVKRSGQISQLWTPRGISIWTAQFVKAVERERYQKMPCLRQGVHWMQNSLLLCCEEVSSLGCCLYCFKCMFSISLLNLPEHSSCIRRFPGTNLLDKM